MYEHPSHSSFIGGKGTGGQKGRQYFGYPGQDPNSPSQEIQIPRSPWNFAMCCFHGLERCPCIARNIKMHFFTKHLLWLTHAGVIPCVKTNDISRILSEKWYLENCIGLHFCIQGHKPILQVPRQTLMSSKSMLQATLFPCLPCKLMCILIFHAHQANAHTPACMQGIINILLC